MPSQNIKIPSFVKLFKQRFLENQQFDFEQCALELFEWQSHSNVIYNKYLKDIKFDIKNPTLQEIPCLPISAFKHHQIKSFDFQPQLVFGSSSTSKTGRSFHYIDDIHWLNQVNLRLFEHNFGPINQKVILGLLPGYLDRKDSSLIHMVDFFIKNSIEPAYQFYNKRYYKLYQKMKNTEFECIVFTVPWAVIEFIENGINDIFSNIKIIETGGMKGQKKEIPKMELHDLINKKLQVKQVSSEYGMTELTSQLYTDGGIFFQSSLTMKFFIKEVNDPFESTEYGKSGCINLIDLGNIGSCAFIQTDDLGRIVGTDELEVLGRLDHSDMRGCNLLV